jgi:hypothetical protein
MRGLVVVTADVPNTHVTLSDPERYRQLVRLVVLVTGGHARALEILKDSPLGACVPQSTLARLCGGRLPRDTGRPPRKARGRPFKEGTPRPVQRVVTSRVIEGVEYLARQIKSPHGGARLADALRIASGIRLGSELEHPYAMALRAEIDAYVRPTRPRWIRTLHGAAMLTRYVRPVGQDLRLNAFRQLGKIIGRDCPDLVQRLAARVKKSGYPIERGVVAWVRIVGPLLQRHDCTLIEMDWRDLLTQDGKVGPKLEKMIRDGVWRETELLGGRHPTLRERLAAAVTPYSHSAAKGNDDDWTADPEDDPKTFELTAEGRQLTARMEAFRRRKRPALTIDIPPIVKLFTEGSSAEHDREMERLLRQYLRGRPGLSKPKQLAGRAPTAAPRGPAASERASRRAPFARGVRKRVR